jgi:hypothetical protein
MARIEVKRGRIVVHGNDPAGLSGIRLVPVEDMKRPGAGQMRFKDGSYLTKQQGVDEDYQREMGIR